MKVYVAALLLLAPSAAAQSVYLVDDDGGPGVHFTTIQDAVNVAIPGDRIDVRAGNYGDTTIARGVTVMCTEPGVIAGDISIHGIAGTEMVILTDFDVVSDIAITACLGTVIVDSIDQVRALAIVDSADARIASISGISNFATTSLSVQRSFAQCVDCRFRLASVSRSEVAISHSSIVGIDGGPGTISGIGMCDVYNGTDALWISAGSTVRLLRTQLSGGRGGTDCFSQQTVGFPGRALRIDGTSTVIRNKVLNVYDPLVYPGTDAVSLDPGGVYDIQTDMTSMRLLGDGSVGSVATFETYAGAGTSVRLYAGRFATKTPFGDSMPRLHSAERGVSLGAMLPSERISTSFVLAPLTRGTLIHGQAMRTRFGGQTELSNSVTLVVR